MSETQLNELLAQLKGDSLLQEKLAKAEDIETSLNLIKEAGYEISKDDWLNYQANQSLELSDDSLEDVQGGGDFKHKRAAKMAVAASLKSERITCSVSIN